MIHEVNTLSHRSALVMMAAPSDGSSSLAIVDSMMIGQEVIAQVQRDGEPGKLTRHVSRQTALQQAYREARSLKERGGVVILDAAIPLDSLALTDLAETVPILILAADDEAVSAVPTRGRHAILRVNPSMGYFSKDMYDFRENLWATIISLKEDRTPQENSLSQMDQRLRVSADVPDWVNENAAAEALAEFIRALSEVHRALGGGGLIVDGMEIESNTLTHA